MERMYNVVRLVEDRSMVNYGKQSQLNASPMTHKEACAFLSKMTKYKWCRDFVVDNGEHEEYEAQDVLAWLGY